MTQTTEKVNQAAELLTAAMNNITSTEAFQAYLTTVANFVQYDYSMRNCLLIAMQNECASKVAGFQTWKKSGRHVKKGEKAIKILAPCPFEYTVKKLDENGNEYEAIAKGMRFRVVSVFDISQTENDDGTPDPDKVPVNILADDVNGFEKLFNAMRTATTAPIDYEEITSGANGYYSPAKHFIRVKSGMPEAQTIKTEAHEIAHSLLHCGECDLTREDVELEAEATAFVVCNYFGIDSSDYSLGYIAGWNPDPKALANSLERIKDAAKKIIEAANAALAA